MNHSNRNNARPARTLLCCALASCMLMAAPAAFAQSTSATVRGQVMVDSAPATDARVTATNTATGLTRSVQSSANGAYSVAGLPPGSYRIDVTAGGQTTSKNVTVAIGQTATLDIGLGGLPEAAATGEATNLDAIVVTGTALTETRTSEVATYISQRQIEALPQASRNFLAFADLVPGMVFETRSNGTSQLRAGGQSSNGINVFIDGVGQKNYVLKGGISGQDQSKGNPFPQLAIGEYKVITSNYKAEYDQISSAAVTAVTRSGTNDFHGSFFWDRTNTPGWSEPTPSEEDRGVEDPSGEDQYGASFGGPLIRDRLFFFVTYESKDFELPREVRFGTTNLPPGFVTPELSSYLQGTSIPFKEDLYFGKLTWQLGDAHLIELSAKIRKEDEITDIGDGPNTLSYGKTQINDSQRLDLRYQFSNQDWLNDMHITHEDDTFNPRAISLENGREINLNEFPADPQGEEGFLGTILRVGGGQDFQEKGQKGLGFQNDLTYFGLEGHTLKAGVKIKSVEINSFEQQPFNPQFRYDYIANLVQGNTAIADFIPYNVRFGAPLPGVGDRNITSKNKQYGIYVQDDWEVNEHLVLNLGLRYDYEETPGYLDYVTPGANSPCDPADPTDNLACSLRNWPNVQNANVDYDIEDYISNGRNRDAFKDAWQPRIGFSYDLSADQRHVIFGGAGRAFDRNLFDYIALEQSKSTFPSYTVNFDTANHPCTVGANNCVEWDPAYYDRETLYGLVAANPNQGSEVNLINNDLKVPYSDQFSLGMRNTFPMMDHDWNTSAAVAHILSHDGILFTLGNRYPDGSYFPPGNTFGGAPFGQPIPGFGTLIIADNGVETRTTQLLLSADKPFSADSPWGVTLAYTYTDSKENRGNAANTDEHYSFDYPNLEEVAFIPSVGISKHRFVATGIAEYWGLTFSTKLVLASPTGNDGLNCAGPTGCANGFFDTYYFDDAKFRQWDVAVQKVWDTGTDLSVRVRADVFNVTNERNYTDFVDDISNSGFGDRNGFGIAGPMRTLKLSFGIDW